MTLAARSPNRMVPRKKSIGSPAVTKKRTRKAAGAAALSSSSSKKRQVQTRTILHYFSPSSQTSQKSSCSPKQAKKEEKHLLSIEPSSPVPFSSLSCSSDKLSQEEDGGVLLCSQESQEIVVEKKQVTKSLDRRSGQNNNCSPYTSINNDGNGGGGGEKRLDCEPDKTKQKQTVKKIVVEAHENHENVEQKVEQLQLSGSKRTRSDDTDCTIHHNCSHAPSLDGCKKKLKLSGELTDHSIDTPTVGDRILIQCPLRDLFVNDKSHVWVSGSITHVDLKQNEMDHHDNNDVEDRDHDHDNLSRCLLTVETIDGEIIHSRYPHKSILVIPSNKENISFDYDEDPSKLYVGDLVEVRYQNKEQWQSGRIANVMQDGKLVNVAYLNGKYEIGVPLGSGNIRLLERGQQSAKNWLVGAKVDYDDTTKFKGKLSSKCKILDILLWENAMKTCGEGECLLGRSDGSTFQMAYDAALVALFSAHKQACLEREHLVRWPGTCNIDYISTTESDTCLSVKKPKVGDVVRMLFKQRDLFVEDIKVWSIGTIVELLEVDDSSSSKIKVVWSDKVEEEYNYPNDDLEILSPKENSDSLVYTSSLSNENGSIVFDPNPRKLQLGDHVQCLYQNGLSHGQWWPGRVAKIHEKENLVDVAYFDGEYEIGIPLNENKINYIESGIDSAEKWLVGAEVAVAAHAKSKGRTRKSKVAMIFKESESVLENAHSLEHIKVLVQSQRGGLVEKSYVYIYTRMISTLYKEKLQDRKVLLWPSYNIVHSSQTKNCTKRAQEVSTDEAQSRHLLEAGNPIGLQELQIEDDSDLDEDIFDTNGPRLSEMQSSLGNACWRALHSSEPQNGYYILDHILSSWKYIPNENLNYSFSTFLLDGPMNDNFKILEPYRTELTFLYLAHVLDTQKVHEDTFRSNSITCLDFEKLLEFPSNEINGKLDAATFSDSDMCILGKQLEFRSMALCFTARCITEELRLFVSSDIEASTETLLKKPFASCILRNGTRDSLKMLIRTYVRFMTKHGHWLIGTSDTNPYSSSSYEQLCALEVERYVKALGTLITYTAWLHSAREKIPLDDHSCCSLIRDTFETEFNTLDQFSQPSKKRVKEKRKKEMKLQLLFALETLFSREFQRELSKMFSVSKEFELVMSA